MTPAASFLAYSFAGWLLESVPRASPSSRYPPRARLWGGAPLPLLPVYGVGGLVAQQLAPRLKGQSLAVRFVSYAAALTAVELVACGASEALWGERAWSYNGCVDPAHSAWWGILGLAVESLVT